MRTIIRILLTAISFFISLALITACLAGYISPKYLWAVAILGLSFPILFILNLLFGAFWLVLWKKEVVISAAGLLCSVWYVPKFASFNNAVNAPAQADTLRVMTYNVHLFSQYDSGSDQKQSMLNFIRNENADVICFQEFFVLDGKLSEKEIKRNLRAYPYSFINYTSEQSTRKLKFGTAIFSKHPILNKSEVEFKRSSLNSSIYADIRVNKDTIRIFCNHLESVKLKEADKPHRWTERIANNDLSADNIKGIVKKLRKAYIIRAEQVDSIKSALDKTPYPTIICGDFNDSPISYTYNTIKGDLSDAFVVAGSGFTQTYQGLLPTIRIDFIFSDKNIQAYRYRSPKVTYSDHFPIVVDFYMNK